MIIEKTTYQSAIKILYEIVDILNKEMGSTTWLEQLMGLYTFKFLSDTIISEEALENVKLYNLTFEYLYEKRYDENIFEVIDETYRNIEVINEKFESLFSVSYFSHTTYLINKNDNKDLIRKVLVLLNQLRFQKIYLEDKELPAQIFGFILDEFSQPRNDCVTPKEICTLIGKLLKPKENNKVYDCACGVGALLIEIFKEIPNRNGFLFGQDINTKNYNYTRMNLIVNDIKSYDIKLGDVLNNPKHLIDGKLEQFDIIASVPPFSINWEVVHNDLHNRFTPDLPPKSKADFAFILHMLSSLNENGKMAVVLPHGILFRGGTEGKIRENLIENNLIDAVIGLPSNLLSYTAIQLCIVIFKKNRKTEDVLFIDASEKFLKQKKNNVLSDDNINEIINTYEGFEKKEKFSSLSSKEKIISNDYNLNIPMYVDIFEKTQKIDVDSIFRQIDVINKDLENKQLEIEDKFRKMKLLK